MSLWIKNSLLLGFVLFVILSLNPLRADREHAEESEKHSFANNHHEEDGDENEAAEILGWIALVSAGVGGLLMLTRRLPIQLSSFQRPIRKIHMSIGVISLLLATLHGWIMFYGSKNLNITHYSGMTALGVFLLIGISGEIASFGKGGRSVRKIHLMLSILLAIAAAIHLSVD